MQLASPETIDHVIAMPSPAAADASGESQWSEIFRSWVRHSWLIVLVAVAGAALAFAYAQTMEVSYESDSALLLDRPSAGKLDNAADRTEYNADERAAMVRSQLEILRGAYVVNDVIQRLHLDTVPMFNPRPNKLTRLCGWIAVQLAARWPRRMVALRNWLAPVTSGVAAGVSRQAIINQIYLQHLSIEQAPDTYVVHVTFRAPDPVLVARIVNAHVASYLGWLRTGRIGAVRGNERWLGAEMERAQKRVIAAEAAVRAFNSQGVLLTVDGRTALDQGLAQLTVDLAVAQANLVKAEARAAEVRRLQATGAGAGIVAMSGSRVLDELQTEHARAVAEGAEVTGAYGPNHPLSHRTAIRSGEIRAAINAETAHYVESIEAEANIARATVTNLQTALDRTRAKVVAAEGDRSQLIRLEGVAATERGIYLNLLQKLRSFDGVTNLIQPEVTVLSPAEQPVLPRSPRPVLMALFGGVIGAGAAAGGIVWRQGRRNVVRHTGDAASLTGVRCLAIMPLLPLRAGRIDRTHPSYGYFGEELRAMCAALLRDRVSEPRRNQGISLLVTSCLPDEGKTTFCHELGRFIASSGARTLIVRADERSHERRGEDGALVSHVAQIDPALPLYGVDWTAPATMFGEQDLLQTISGWQREYGLVVFDTPPPTAMAESLVLSSMVDLTVVLARVDRTPRSLLAGVTTQIAGTGGRLAGVVLTFVRLGSQRGVMPSDPAYWFNRNRGYQRQVVPARGAARI
jgi:succinoglycan biosynthesis transport protein ExoP